MASSLSSASSASSSQFKGEEESTYPFIPETPADEMTRAHRRSNVLSFIGGAVSGGFAVMAVMGLKTAIGRAAGPHTYNTFDTVSSSSSSSSSSSGGGADGGGSSSGVGGSGSVTHLRAVVPPLPGSAFAATAGGAESPAVDALSDVPGGGIGSGSDTTFVDPLLINVHSCAVNCGYEPFKDPKVYESEVRFFFLSSQCPSRILFRVPLHRPLPLHAWRVTPSQNKN